MAVSNPTASLDKSEIILNKSQLQMASPGDIFFFRYKQELNIRQVLIVNTPKYLTGKFKSSIGNLLVCCFELDSNSLGNVFRYFFKNSINSSYSTGLRLFFGQNKFKTFNMEKSTSGRKINLINRNSLGQFQETMGQS